MTVSVKPPEKLDIDDVLLRAMYFADKADPGICFFLFPG